ncbi:hypothetical protein E1193_13495 [Micromonospora sp. KC606]|uniref:hypothetical protein n=1 Tax=Micromonospora sp. KC606 TaxID=2530379 RepID=UPI001047A35B|nr:hypothetical protein [Micromonospora sp. KC606]TDC81911.1 hypothetical protein E1193_13495 [Micromonospora sp. KC606]
MTTAAGDLLTPSRLNPAAFQLQLGSLYNLTSTPTDLTLTNVTPGYASGATSYTVPEGGMVGVAVWSGDFQLTTAGTITACVLELTIGGLAVSTAPQVIWDPENIAAGARVTLANSWPLSLAAGSHSFGLRASMTSTSGAVRLNQRHTALSILLHP